MLQACVDWATAHATSEGLTWFEGKSVFFCCYEQRVKDCFDEAVQRYRVKSLRPVWTTQA